MGRSGAALVTLGMYNWWGFSILSRGKRMSQAETDDGHARSYGMIMRLRREKRGTRCSSPRSHLSHHGHIVRSMLPAILPPLRPRTPTSTFPLSDQQSSSQSQPHPPTPLKVRPPLASPNPLADLPSDLPPDPYTYPVPSTPIILLFYSYGNPLPDPNATQLVLAAAYHDATAHPPHAPILPWELHYSETHSDTVELVLRTKNDIDWLTWRFALLGLMAFMQTWDNVWLCFDIRVAGREGKLGTGRFFGWEGDRKRSDGVRRGGTAVGIAFDGSRE